MKSAADKSSKSAPLPESIIKFMLSNREYVDKGWVSSGEVEQIQELSHAQIIELLRDSIVECHQAFEKHMKDLVNEYVKDYIVWRFGHSRKLVATIFAKQKPLEELPKLQKPPSLAFIPEDKTPEGGSPGVRTPPNVDDNINTEPRKKSVSSLGRKSGISLSPKPHSPAKPFLLVRIDLPGRKLKETKLLKGTWCSLKKALRIATYDGTDCIYYPSGLPAILCIGYLTDSLHSHYYVYDNKPNMKMLAVISPPNDCTCYASDGKIIFHISEANGIYLSEWNKDYIDYEIPINWKTQDHLEFSLNENIILHYKKNDGFKLIYKTATDYLSLNLSKEAVHLPMEYIIKSERKFPPLYVSITQENSQVQKNSAYQDLRVEMHHSDKILIDICEQLKGYQEQINNIIKNLQTAMGIDKRPWSFAISHGKVSEKILDEEVAEQDNLPKKETEQIKEELPETQGTLQTEKQLSVTKEFSSKKDLTSRKDILSDSELNDSIKEIIKSDKLISEMPLRMQRHRTTPICNVVLRYQILQKLEMTNILKQEYKTKFRMPSCECSSTEIPYIMDVEFKEFIEHQAPAEQVVVICITSFKKPETKAEKVLTNIYSLINKSRRKPCLTFPPDSFKILRYDLAKAYTGTSETRSYLSRQHEVSEGMVLMYLTGKLVFCDTQFNGYGMNEKDFTKQINETYKYALRGFYFPDDFKFG